VLVGHTREEKNEGEVRNQNALNVRPPYAFGQRLTVGSLSQPDLAPFASLPFLPVPMSTSVEPRALDQPPDAATLSSLRDEANAEDTSIEVTYPSPDGPEKRLVVSPRGTVVVLTDVSEATFNRSTSAADIAEQLRA